VSTLGIMYQHTDVSTLGIMYQHTDVSTLGIMCQHTEERATCSKGSMNVNSVRSFREHRGMTGDLIYAQLLPYLPDGHILMCD